MAVERVIFTTIGPTVLGRRCLKAIFTGEMPKAFSACTNSASFSESTLLRAMRYMLGQPVRIKIRIMFRRLCPTSATMIIISTICGKDRNTSEILRISRSAQPPL